MAAKATNSLYTIEEITGNIVTILPGATTEDRVSARQWAGLAVRDIGCQSRDVKVCQLFPKNGQFEKPKDVVAAIDIALFNSTGAEIKYNFHPATGSRIHISRFTTFDDLALDGAGTTVQQIFSRVDLAEDTYHYNLGGDNWQQVNYALFRYFSLPVDTDGMPLIPEINVIPIMMFARYMWALKKGDNQSEIQLAKQNWYEERDRAKGRAKMPDMVNGVAILRTWMSLISAPKFNIS